MAINKSLYAAPEGLDEIDNDVPEIEIEIEDPEAVRIGLGGMEIDIVKGEGTGEEFDANLAELMDDGVLGTLGAELVEDFDKDIGDRRDWIQTYVDGLKLLGLKYEERTEPWNGA